MCGKIERIFPAPHPFWSSVMLLLLLFLLLSHSSSTLIRRHLSLVSFCMQMIYARKCPGRRVGAKNWIRECQRRLISQSPRATSLSPPPLNFFHPSQMSGHGLESFLPPPTPIPSCRGRLQFLNCWRGLCMVRWSMGGFLKYLLNILLSPRGRGRGRRQAATHDRGLYPH